MAKAIDIPTDLTLDIGGDISPDDFVAAVRNFFGYIKEITEAQEGDGSKIEWAVKVKEGSSLIKQIMDLHPYPREMSKGLACLKKA
jgi:hypothetical protein